MSSTALRPAQRLAGFRLAFDRVAPIVFLAILPLAVLGLALLRAVHDNDLAVDFHNELYPEAKLVLHGTNPYPPPSADLSAGTNTIWPVAALAPVLPLTLLPPHAADAVATALVLAALVATLLVLEVRDWRVFGVTLLWPPVISAYQTANLTLPLCLVVALVWRYRQKEGRTGMFLGIALAAKFFLWPLMPLLVSIKRRAAAILAAALATASLALILPFVSLAEYFRLVRNLSKTFDGRSYTSYGFLTDAGVSGGVARFATLALGVALLAVAYHRRSVALTTGAALALSPIVWLHFFALLAVPLAIVRPRFGWPWLLPLLMILAPGTGNGRPWQSGLVLVVAGATVVWCARAEGHDPVSLAR